MAQESLTQHGTAQVPVAESSSVNKQQIKVEEIVESLQCVRNDAEQIGRLLSEERFLVEQFFDLLPKLMQPRTPCIAVSTSVFPVKIGAVAQAQVDSFGRLRLIFGDGRLELLDLNDAENRDLLVAVVGDIVPKLNDLNSQSPAEEEFPEPAQVQVIPAQIPNAAASSPPAFFPLALAAPQMPPIITIEIPIALPDLAPAQASEMLQMPEATVSLADNDAQIAEIENETLAYLEMLGNEVFEYAPVSKYFDDWMVNLRQIILSFESSEVIGPDEAFTAEYNQIFGNIEDELAKRLVAEAGMELSARQLVENRYLLDKIAEGYAAQSKELVVKGKSAIDYLTRNVQQLEAELAEVSQIKTSYRHLREKMAKDQKMSELTQKLNAAKKRLALTVGTSSVDKGKAGDLDAEYAVQMQELGEQRKNAIGLLANEVHAIEEELVQIERTKTLNSVKRAQKRFDTTQKLIAAKKRLELAEQNNNAEQERLRTEYEQKKQAAMGKVQTLEKDIATKATDNSAEVRRQAAKALANAVKLRVQRKTATSQQAPPLTSE